MAGRQEREEGDGVENNFPFPENPLDFMNYFSYIIPKCKFTFTYSGKSGKAIERFWQAGCYFKRILGWPFPLIRQYGALREPDFDVSDRKMRRGKIERANHVTAASGFRFPEKKTLPFPSRAREG
jgi:hypothetical protein